MIPRACGDDRCDYDTTGWVHVPGCWETEDAERDAWIEDAATATAREDGVAGRRPASPAQQRRAA